MQITIFAYNMALKIRNPFYWDSQKKEISNNLQGPILGNKFELGLFDLFKGFQNSESDFKKLIQTSYRTNHDVFSVIGLITKRASQLNWTVYELKDKKNSIKARSEYESYQKAGDIYGALRTKAKYYAVSENKDLNQLMKQPNRIQTMPNFVEEALGYKLLTGNRFLYKLKPTGFKTASQIFILPSHFMTIKLKEGANYLSRYNVVYLIDSDFNLEFTTDEVFHSKTWNPAMNYQGFLWGFSPLQAAKKLVDKSNSSYDASVFAYENMGMAGILSQGPTRDEEGGFLTPKEAKAITDKFNKDTAGAKNFKKVIATSAQVSWTNLGLSPVDLAIIESQKMDREQICNIWNVPVQMMNSQEASTRDNMLTAERSFYLNTVIPEMCDLRDVFNEFIVKEYGEQYYVDFDSKSIPALQIDLKTLADRLKEEVGLGIITRNEYREIVDHGEIDPKFDPEGIAGKLILPNTHNPKIRPEPKTE